MCGRFALFTPPAAVTAKTGAKVADDDLVPRYNISPGTHIAVVKPAEGSPVIEPMWWGYKPHWAGAKAPQPINATIEKVGTSGYFKQGYAHARCVVPVDGWYEWDKSEDPKRPHFICRQDRELIWLAAIYTERADGKLGCAIVTEPARGPAKDVHDRMPLALDDESLDIWLDPEFTDPRTVGDAITHIETRLITHWPISTRINKPAGNGDHSLLNPL
ncbi:SOS response-associated peptidase [Vreelandella populi]|uniref:SOS response-associated peptidase n=1 Tax=Vreelandella populi TaxID=2498858 RepID=UPI000F8E6A2E|nr:SOS response-associated peptidase [Halomonas populi]RUR51432.1 SOS response-associated peptidase [Halomonas populi]